MFENFKCEKCELHKVKLNYVLPHGNINGRILIIGEAPGREEDREGKPFVGPSGALLREALDKAGISISDINITNTIMCRPPNNRQPMKEELEACKEHWQAVIAAMPNLQLIILLGAVAVQAVLKQKNIMDKRGTIIKKDGRDFLPILHPAAILRDSNKKEMFFRDFVFAKNYIEKSFQVGEYKLCNTLELANSALDLIQDKEYIAFDIETSAIDEDEPNLANDEIIGVSFTSEPYKGYYIPFISVNTQVFSDEQKTHIVNRLRDILTHPKKKLILHNGKFDANFLKAKFNIDIVKFFKRDDGSLGTNLYFDTMLAHHLLWQAPPHGLKFLSRIYPDLAYYESELKEYKDKNKIKNYAMIPQDVMYKYAATDADATIRLFYKYWEELSQKNLLGLFFTAVMPLVPVLCQAEYYGAKIDKKALLDLKVILENKIKTLEKEIYELAGEEFNINSPVQKAKILYEKLGIPKPKNRTKKSGSLPTDKETLSKIDHPIVTKLIEYAHETKMKSTYVDSLLEKADRLDRIHTNYKQHGTATGRLSSSQPNLQNIPAEKQYRQIFISEKGYSLVGSDFSQIELRVLARVSQDPKLLQAFMNGEDIHDQVAREIFNIPPEEKVSKDIRRVAKTINFGIVYGIQAQALSKQINSDEGTAQEYINRYLYKYRKVAEFQEYIKAFVREHKFVKNIFGRIHHIPEIDSPDRFIQGEAERTALNSPIQGSAAEITNASAVQIYLAFERENIDAKLVLTVHDELVYEVKNEQVIRAATIIYNTMRSIAEHHLKIPVPVDQYINDKWLEHDIDDHKFPALHQARYLRKIGIKARDFFNIPKGYVSAIPRG